MIGRSAQLGRFPVTVFAGSKRYRLGLELG